MGKSAQNKRKKSWMRSIKKLNEKLLRRLNVNDKSICNKRVIMKKKQKHGEKSVQYKGKKSWMKSINKLNERFLMRLNEKFLMRLNDKIKQRQFKSMFVAITGETSSNVSKMRM